MSGAKFLIGIWFIFSLLTCLSAEELILEGKIRDANTHRAIPGVNVYVQGQQFGTVTNSSGYFHLKVLEPDPEMIVVFQHVGYDTLHLVIEDVLSINMIDLQERVITTPVVQAVNTEDQPEIAKDLPQTVSIIDARVFDLRGYTDIGDLLKKDHSIQVDEELSGKKTVSIRGGSPDEVVVLHNGIKLNSSLDNIYDISLIDLNDVQRLEVIKGSNNALYGPQAFSGVINIVPWAQRDYNIRFQQRVGSYSSSDQGLHLYKRTGQLYGGYSFQKGSSERGYADETGDPGLMLKNASEYHTASLAYNFSEALTGAPQTSLRFMYFRSHLDYENQRNDETLANFNQMLTARFEGDLGKIKNLTMSGAYQWLDESQFIRFYNASSDSGFLDRKIDDRSWNFNADKSLDFKRIELLLGYQFENSKLEFEDNRVSFANQPLGFEAATLERQHHGFVSVAKLNAPSGSDFIRGVDFDVSFRYDVVKDRQIGSERPQVDALAVREPNEVVLDDSWEEGVVKFSTHLSGSDGKFAFKGFFNMGTNVKFPSLLQQISTRELLSSPSTQADLEPERNRSMEIGLDISREVRNASGVLGWQISGNFFRNAYDNKFVTYFLPGTPVAIYDNVQNASITGFETKQSLFLFRKKMTMEFGASRYIFSDRSAFPFKYDRKFTYDIMLDQAGYSLQLHAFKEGEKIAQVRDEAGGFYEAKVPAFTNLDVHFGKAFNLNKVKLILNASLRNLLDDDFKLEGLTLRDRRYYLTLGIQY